MRIRKLRKITYITILTSPTGLSEYNGNSFEAILNDGTITGFKDWLNLQETFIKNIEGFTYTKDEGFDIDYMNVNSMSKNNSEFVINRLQQKLSIQYNELKYSYMPTTNVGIPYINKKSKEEMDLIFKNQIRSTEGVREILSFTSSVENRIYKLKFSIRSKEGEIIWLSINQ